MGAWRLLAILGLALVPEAVRGQLDAELDKPYRLQVVLRVADNRFLTPVFTEQLRQSLGDQLALSLGRLAQVEVFTNHPLLADVEAKGLETALDGWEQISGLTTHFVFVDFERGTYSLSARHYDGMTGLAGPGVRSAQTSDRSLVARLAARLVEQDFGVVGTATLVGKEVRLAIKGGNLGVSLERWVKPGEVFAISRISKTGDMLRGARVPWALLEVIDAPRSGVSRCRLHHRYQQDDLREMPGVLGYRCLHVATTPGPINVQFVDDENSRPLVGLQVYITRPGGGKVAEYTTNHAGLVHSREAYPHFALVQVVSGSAALARFPLALTGAGTALCRLKTAPEAEKLIALEYRRDQWVRRIADNRRLAFERVEMLNSELGKSLDTALAIARAGLKSMEGEITELDAEREQMARQTANSAATVDFREGDLALDGLRARRKELDSFVLRWETAQKEAVGPAALAQKKHIERARLFEAEADYDQAIAVWKEVLKANPEQAKIQEHLSRLEKDWVPKSAQHAEARAYLLKTWPRVEAAALDQTMSKAQEALSVCGKAGDTLTPRRLLHVIGNHTANLRNYLAALHQQNDVDSAPKASAMAQVIAGLRRLHAEATVLAGKKFN